MFSVVDDESHAGLAESHVDRDVIGAIAGEPVDLVDDAVRDFVGLDVVDHLHQRGAVGLPCGFPDITNSLRQWCPYRQVPHLRVSRL